MQDRKKYLTEPEKSIEVGKKSISKLLEEMAQTGFQGKRLGEAARIWAEMTQQKGPDDFHGLLRLDEHHGPVEARQVADREPVHRRPCEHGRQHLRGHPRGDGLQVLPGDLARQRRGPPRGEDRQVLRHLRRRVRVQGARGADQEVREHPGHEEGLLDEGVPQQVRGVPVEEGDQEHHGDRLEVRGARSTLPGSSTAGTGWRSASSRGRRGSSSGWTRPRTWRSWAR